MADEFDALDAVSGLIAELLRDYHPCTFATGFAFASVQRDLGIGSDADRETVRAALAKALGLALTDSQRFQIQQARDILGTWDLNDPGGVGRETVLADQIRKLLAIIDEKRLADGD